MLGLYGMVIYLAVAVIAVVGMLALGALFFVVCFAIGLVTHPILTIALALHWLAALAGGLALIAAVASWFLMDHAQSDFIPVFAGSIGVIVISVVIRFLTGWLLDR